MKGSLAQPSTPLSYGDYVEQLTFLLFLKMADEQSRPPFKKPSPIPKGFNWEALIKLDGDDLETHYRHTLEELGNLDIFWRKDEALEDSANLPAPDIIAREIVDGRPIRTFAGNKTLPLARKHRSAALGVSGHNRRADWRGR